MARIRHRPPVIILVLLALLAAACGDDDDTGAGARGPSGTEAPGTEAPGTEAPGTVAPGTDTTAATSDQLDDSDPVKILFVAGATGPTAASVADAQRAIEASIADIESRGGVLGRTVKLEVLDTGGDPTQAVSVLQGYLSQNDAPDFVIPGISSAEALALVPLLTREKIVSMNNAANPDLNNPGEYPYHFGYSATSEGLQAGLPDLLQKMDVKSLAVIVPNNAYGTSIADAVQNVLRDTDVTTTVELFNPEDLDISVSYERAISGNPDAVFFEAIGDITQRLVEARLAVGATDIPTIAGFGISSIGGGPADWADPAALENLVMQVFRFQVYTPPEEYTDVQRRFFENMEAHGGLTSNVLTPGLFWDVAQVLAAAANEAGSTDADAVKEVLESDSFEFPELMMWSQHGYTADRHFPDPVPDDFTAIAPSPMVNGMFKTES